MKWNIIYVERATVMKVEVFTLGPVMTNCYLFYDERTNKGIIFDPGLGPREVIQRIKELNLQIEAILVTHAHFDHIGGLEEVRQACFSPPVYIHQIEADWLTDPLKNGSGLWPGMEPIACAPAEHLLNGGETLQLLGHSFQVLHTPGHSPGSISFVCDQRIISGDVLFAGSIGRTDLPQGDFATLMRSIKDRLLVLPSETEVLPGHGPATTIGQERTTNPFINGQLH